MENAARQNFSRAQAPQVPIQQPRHPSRPSGSRGASPRFISNTIIGKGPLPLPLPVVKAAASRAKPRSAESSPAPHAENPEYPYAQYPRYYDYASRPAANPEALHLQHHQKVLVSPRKLLLNQQLSTNK